MKRNQFINGNILFMLIGMTALVFLGACGDDETPDPDPKVEKPVPAFAVAVDGLTATFTNASSGADSYSWDFGDGKSSTDKDPVHAYADGGTFKVTLTATNSAGDSTASKDIEVTKPGVLKTFISGKKWQLVRGNKQSIALGPTETAGTGWTDQTGMWFALGGDASNATCAAVRISLMNDIYTFNSDNTYTVDFKGDFWGEYGIWAGTEFDEKGIDITGGSLPKNAAGKDVDAFIKGSWEYRIDEAAKTIEVIGAGAHIINPRYKNDESSHEVGDGIKYNIEKFVEGTQADTLLIYIDTHDNDWNSFPRQYMTLASYKETPPEVEECVAACDNTEEISASEISHTFASEDGKSDAISTIESSSTVTYGVDLNGVTCTKYERSTADAHTDLKFNIVDKDIRFDTDGTYDFSKAQVDVYIPAAENTFKDGGLLNQVMVKLADRSCIQNFWENWATEAKTDIATDEWVTVVIDFTDKINNPDASDGIRDDFDSVILEFGGSDHKDAGVIYYKDFKFIK